MTTEVKNFIEVNVDLLDSNPTEFFMLAHNGLSINCQKELVNILHETNIDVDKYREITIHYIITMYMDDIERPLFLSTFIERYLLGIVGYDYDWLLNYILDNEHEWDDTVDFDIAGNGEFLISPKEQ